MLIAREVLEKFRDAYPQFSYKPDHNRSEHFDGSRYIHAFFDTVIDLATYEKPRVYPEGIVHVIVNGTFVVNNSKHTGSRVGKIIKRSS